MDVVVFEIESGQRCCVPMGVVTEVIALGPVTPIPSAPPALIGAVNVHGQVCPVLRLEVLLQHQTNPTAPRLGQPCMLLTARDCQVVLCVRRIEEVARMRRSRVLSSSDTLLISAVLDTPGGPLRLIDMDHVVRRVTDQLHHLARSIEVPIGSTP